MKSIHRLLLLAFVVSGLSGVSYAQVYEFDNCGATGRTGPDPGDCNYGNFSVDIVGEGIQEWTVPDDGTYRISAEGAEGGEYTDEPAEPGKGAKVSGNITLNEGEDIQIVVGQEGSSGPSSDHAPGGGGGSFVVRPPEDPILIAAGGTAASNGDKDGVDGEAENTRGEGGGDDQRNSGCPGASGPGAGFDTNGCDITGDITGEDEWVGRAFTRNSLGGVSEYDGDCTGDNCHGGFGGGGSGRDWSSCGGGGGYHGGDSGGDSGCNPSDAGVEPATSYIDSDAEVHDRVSGANEGHGRVKIELVDGQPDFCNFRGPVNECIMNETNQLNNRQYNVSSIFESRSNAVFEAFNGPAKISIGNSSRISGLWQGAFRIETEAPRLEAGASFRPENGRIKIGK